MSNDIKDAKECCFNMLKIHFASGWKNAVLSDMKFKRIFGGCTSFLFYCSYENCEPQDVVFRFFRSNDEDSNPFDLKFIGESAETLVFYILSKLDFGPKLYSTFNGGRIEEFINGNILSREDVLSKVYNKTIIRKIGYFHSLNLPIVKDNQWLNRYYNIYDQELDKLKDEYLKLDRNLIKNKLKIELLKFDLKQQLIWIKDCIPKLNSRIVFSHNDITKRNIMVKNDENLNLNEKLVIIDFGDCAYNYRALDLADFLRCKVYKDKLKTIEDYKLHIYDEYEINEICSWYLNAFKLHASNIDENIDNINSIVKEVNFFLLLSDLMTILYLSLGCLYEDPSKCETELDYGLNRIALYKYTKEKFFIKYKDQVCFKEYL